MAVSTTLGPNQAKKEEENICNVESNPFAFIPEQLSKLTNPKSLSVFVALGGLAGIATGLKTNIRGGISIGDDFLTEPVSFDNSGGAGTAEKSLQRNERRKQQKDTIQRVRNQPNEISIADRKRVFGENKLPTKKSISIWRLAWIALHDRVLILLSIAAIVSLALGLYRTFGSTHEELEGAKVEWVEGVAIIVAILIVVVVGALNDWQKERQFAKLNRQKEDRQVKVIRSGKTVKISIYDVLVGDVMVIEQGDVLPVDGVYIDGYNISCDESSASGESELIKKTPAEKVFRNIVEERDVETVDKLDPFMISGTQVSEGVGSFLVTAVGVHSSYGKTLVSLREETEFTPLQFKLNALAGRFAPTPISLPLIAF